MVNIRLVSLTQGLEALVDESDWPIVRGYNWSVLTSATSGPYAATDIDKQCVLMHRLIMEAVEGLDVDHRNSNGLDNRRENLRVCTRSQNCANRRMQSNNTSGYKGVDFHKGRWRARVTQGSKQRHLGYFATALDAAIAYDHYAKYLFGDFALLNFQEKKSG